MSEEWHWFGGGFLLAGEVEEACICTLLGCVFLWCMQNRSLAFRSSILCLCHKRPERGPKPEQPYGVLQLCVSCRTPPPRKLVKHKMAPGMDVTLDPLPSLWLIELGLTMKKKLVQTDATLDGCHITLNSLPNQVPLSARGSWHWHGRTSHCSSLQHCF